MKEMKQGNVTRPYILQIAVILLSLRAAAGVAGLSQWPNHFECDELGAKDSGMVMEYALDRGTPMGKLTVSGFQTDSSYIVRTSIDGEDLLVRFESQPSLVVGHHQLYQKNDLLFRLRSISDGQFKLIFEKVRPGFDEKLKEVICDVHKGSKRGENMSQKKFSEKLVTLTSIPAAQDLRDIHFTDWPGSPPITVELFKKMWSTCKPVKSSDPSIEAWNYSPWLNGDFTSKEGKYSFRLFLGGRGKLTTPKGETGFFDFDASLAYAMANSTGVENALMSLKDLRRKLDEYLNLHQIKADFTEQSDKHLEVKYHVKKMTIDTSMYYIDRRPNHPQHTDEQEVPLVDGLKLEIEIATFLPQLLIQHETVSHLGSSQTYSHKAPEGKLISTSLWFAPPIKKLKLKSYDSAPEYEPFLIYNIEYGTGVKESFIKDLLKDVFGKQ
jgi:hypothetical protein